MMPLNSYWLEAPIVPTTGGVVKATWAMGDRSRMGTGWSVAVGDTVGGVRPNPKRGLRSEREGA